MINMKTVITCLAAAVLFLVPVRAASAAILFCFLGPEANVEGVPQDALSGSTTIKATPRGGQLVGGVFVDAGFDAYITPLGLGVARTPPDRVMTMVSAIPPVFINTFDVDGRGGISEVIRLEFSTSIKLIDAFFTNVGPLDSFGLAIDGVNIGTFSFSDPLFKPAGSALGIIRFPDALPLGTTIDFIAADAKSAWNLRDVNVVPEPTTLAVWSALGLCVGAFRRWRPRKRTMAA
jgi:hypothetical protein